MKLGKPQDVNPVRTSRGTGQTVCGLVLCTLYLVPRLSHMTPDLSFPIDSWSTAGRQLRFNIIECSGPFPSGDIVSLRLDLFRITASAPLFPRPMQGRNTWSSVQLVIVQLRSIVTDIVIPSYDRGNAPRRHLQCSNPSVWFQLVSHRVAVQQPHRFPGVTH